MEFHVYCDGGYSSRSKCCGFSYVIKDEWGDTLERFAKCDTEIDTTIQAEYAGLIFGAIAALRYSPSRLFFYTDNKLVAAQALQEWATTELNLRALRDAFLTTLESVDWTLTWIPREENAEADELLNGIIRGRKSKKKGV